MKLPKPWASYLRHKFGEVYWVGDDNREALGMRHVDVPRPLIERPRPLMIATGTGSWRCREGEPGTAALHGQKGKVDGAASVAAGSLQAAIRRPAFA